MKYNNLSIKQILERRVRNQPSNPLNRKSLQTLRHNSSLVGAEVGVSCGENAFDLLVKLDIEKLYLIDPYQKFLHWPQDKLDEHRDIAHSLLYLFKDKIVWLRDYSNKAVLKINDLELDFVYIDGGHDLLTVGEDIKLYWPKVKIGGLFCGDNLEIAGVSVAVQKFMHTRKEKFWYEENLDTDSIDWWFIKDNE